MAASTSSVLPVAALTVSTALVGKLRRLVLVVLVQSELVLSAPALQLLLEAVAVTVAVRTLAVEAAAVERLPVVAVLTVG